MRSGAVERRALILCPEAPFPAIGGGPLRTASVVHYLAQRYTLDVITFREPGAPDPRDAFPPDLVRRVAVLDLPHHEKTPAARAARNLRRALQGVPPHEDRFRGFPLPLDGRYHVIVAEHFWTTSYLPQLRPAAEKLVLDLHNLESVFYERRAQHEKQPLATIFRRFAQINRRLERQRYPLFDTILCPSAADAQLTGQPHAAVVANTIPWRDAPRRQEDPALAFSGNMEFPPNLTGADWFASEVWPGLVEQHPELRWRLIGKNPEAIQPLADRTPNTQVTGPVADAIEEIARCQIAIVPLQSGSGTRLKIIEAWAAGVPVVSTTLGAEGLEAESGRQLLIADTPADFAQAIHQLLVNKDLRERIGRAGRGFYEERYTWKTAWDQLSRAGI